MEPGKRTGIFKRCFLFNLARLLASGLCSRHATALPTQPQAQEYDGADGLDSQLGRRAQNHSATSQVSWQIEKRATTFFPSKSSKWLTPSLKDTAHCRTNASPAKHFLNNYLKILSLSVCSYRADLQQKTKIKDGRTQQFFDLFQVSNLACCSQTPIGPNASSRRKQCRHNRAMCSFCST